MNDPTKLSKCNEYNITQSFNRLKTDLKELFDESSGDVASNMASAVLLSSTIDHWGECIINELSLLRQAIASLGYSIDNLDHSAFSDAD